MDVWTEVAAQRRALADRVDGLDPAKLDRPSWCDGWRVRDVLGHLVYLAEATRIRVLVDMVRRGPNPDKALRRLACSLGDLPRDELTARLRAAAGGRFHTPGAPAVVVLGELLVHGADMMRPLGHVDAVDPDLVGPLLPVYGRIGRLAFHTPPARRVTLVATDADLTFGKGPPVRGSAIDLLLLLANRRQVVPRLSGPGLDAL